MAHDTCVKPGRLIIAIAHASFAGKDTGLIHIYESAALVIPPFLSLVDKLGFMISYTIPFAMDSPLNTENENKKMN